MLPVPTTKYSAMNNSIIPAAISFFIKPPPFSFYLYYRSYILSEYKHVSHLFHIYVNLA